MMLHGDNLQYIKSIPDNSIAAVVTDAPYGLGKEPDPSALIRAWLDVGYKEVKGKGFMGKEWDAFVPQPAFWKEVYRVLKPGGYVLCFFGTRTYDWGTLAIRLAGFEIRDCIQWIYGSGFPKSLNVVKAGANSEWEGYGTALKPAYEPICVARKPLDGTVVENVLKHRCGALNLDGCRIGEAGGRNNGRKVDSDIYGKFGPTERVDYGKGRFPANIIFDEEAAGVLDQQSGILTSGQPVGIQRGDRNRNVYGKFAGDAPITGYGDIGGASRFFYCAKASSADRNYGLPTGSKNTHPTVKPIKLMRYLVRLVKSPFNDCTILDPYAGSGTTGVACALEGVCFIGCEQDQESYNIAKARIEEAEFNYIIGNV